MLHQQPTTVIHEQTQKEREEEERRKVEEKERGLGMYIMAIDYWSLVNASHTWRIFIGPSLASLYTTVIIPQTLIYFYLFLFLFLFLISKFSSYHHRLHHVGLAYTNSF